MAVCNGSIYRSWAGGVPVNAAYFRLSLSGAPTIIVEIARQKSKFRNPRNKIRLKKRCAGRLVAIFPGQETEGCRSIQLSQLINQTSKY